MRVMKRISGLLLLPVLAVSLAACGAAEEKASSVADKASSAAAEAGSGAAYGALDSAAGSFDEQARTYAANLQDCLDQATAEQDKVACGQDSLNTVKQGWAPVQSALDALTGIAQGPCKEGLQKVSEQAAVWTQDAAPGSAQEAEVLPTKLSDSMDGVVQAVQELKTACTSS